MTAEEIKIGIEILEKLQASALSDLEHIEKCGQPFTVRNREDKRTVIEYLRCHIHSFYSTWLDEHRKESDELKEKKDD